MKTILKIIVKKKPLKFFLLIYQKTFFLIKYMLTKIEKIINIIKIILNIQYIYEDFYIYVHVYIIFISMY